MTTKHTPGPWHWGNDALWAPDGSGRSDRYAAVVSASHKYEEGTTLRVPVDADAHLIIAAPEMYRVLQAVLPTLATLHAKYQRDGYDWSAKLVKQLGEDARRVLAKADGEP